MRNVLTLTSVISLASLLLVSCAGSSDAGTNNRPVDADVSPSVLQVRETVDEFTEIVGQVDIESIYDELEYDPTEMTWEEFKLKHYEEHKPLVDDVLAFTDYDENADEQTKIDHVTLAISHVSYMHFPYAFFLEGETPYMEYDNDFIFVNDADDHAEVYLVPNDAVDNDNFLFFWVPDDKETFKNSIPENEDPLELYRDDNGEWIVDVDTLAPELADNYLEEGDVWY